MSIHDINRLYGLRFINGIEFRWRYFNLEVHRRNKDDPGSVVPYYCVDVVFISPTSFVGDFLPSWISGLDIWGPCALLVLGSTVLACFNSLWSAVALLLILVLEWLQSNWLS